MDKVKIIPTDDNINLNQIYQAVNIEFAFATPTKVKNTFQQVHEFVLCKDYLHDAIYASLKKSPYSVYGFKFDPTVKTVYLNKTLLLAKTKGIHKHLDDILKLLHTFDRRLKIKRSKLYKTQKKDTILIEGSKTWMSAPPMISLYSLLVRLAVTSSLSIRDNLKETSFAKLMSAWKHTRTTPNATTDYTYLKMLGEYLPVVLSNRTKLGFAGYAGYTDTTLPPPYTFHNFAGIISLCDIKHNYGTCNIPELKERHALIARLTKKRSTGK